MDHLQDTKKIKIELDADWLNKYVQMVSFDSFQCLIPKDPSIFEYWDYFKEYLSKISIEFSARQILDIKKSPYYRLEPDFISSYSFRNVYILAEFPDEETALYFRLKYS